MKKIKLAASLVAVSVAATALLSGCATVPETPSNDGTQTTPKAESPATTNAGDNTNTDDNQGGTQEATALQYDSGTVLRMATGYNSADTGLSMDPEIAGEGIKLADGNTYNAGDLKPTWVEVENRLDIKIDDKYQGNSASNEFDYWREQLDQVDIVSGTATKLTEAGNNGLVVNLADHLDEMPNFKAYLEANPIVRISITGDTDTGSIFFSPYFDGVNDIERMPLMRADWVVKLLDGDGAFEAASSGTTATPAYQPYMPTSGSVSIDVVKLDGSGTETVTKNYDKAGNIVAKMNEAGAISGVEAVNMLRTYIDEAYDGYYGTTRSNLFIGQNAAWDADELVALLRCVVANSQTLNGTDTVQGIFSREDNNNQRKVDIMRFAAHLFGVRGLESRSDYLYVGTDNKLHDARMEEDAYIAMERMNNMAKEGLISTNFLNNAEAKSDQYLETDTGFMSYDYNQTQTAYNETKLNKDKEGNPTDEGEKYIAAMVPVALWHDGSNADGVYMRFTESWRSVKTDGWGISVAGTASDPNKLNAALALIDYAYSEAGQILMSYGPDAFIKTNSDGSYVTFEFNGKEMPVISDETYKELWDKANGNYTNYARKYLGSTLSFAKSQAFEYQCTQVVGKEGAANISKAIALGTIKHPELDVASNAWYTSVPTVLPNYKTENDEINTYDKLGSKGMFSTSSSTKEAAENLFVNIIVGGYSGEGTSSREETIKTVSDSWGATQVISLRNDAWDRLLEYYKSIS
ncbi:MAG: hypothetical protein NC203_03490 [Firmicutes bacterium]|nr:hypothetical protein [[Eubacterium] siraeum]MCM1487409.1 hypothetical protein [Bacillota bacterium]